MEVALGPAMRPVEVQPAPGAAAAGRPPAGRPNDFAPVVSAQFLKERYEAVTIG